MRGGGADLFLTHASDLIDLFAKLGRIGVDRDEVSDKGIDLGVELGFLFGRDRNKAGGFLRRYIRHRIGRRKRKIGRFLGGGGDVFFRRRLSAHAVLLLPDPPGGRPDPAAIYPNWAFQLY